MIQTRNTEIKMIFYSEQFKPAIDHYVINEIHFTGSPKEAIKLCEKDKERHPVLILCEDELIGFFILHEWEGAKKYTDNHHALLLRTFSIDSRYQGHGYGCQTIELLDEFVNRFFPRTDEIVLGVNHNNFPAKNLYLNHGFSDTGRRVIGIHGEQWVLSRKIK